jgi:hypothetical protein
MEVRATFFCNVLSKLEDDYLFTTRMCLVTKPISTLNTPILEKGSFNDLLSQQEGSSTSKFSDCVVS